MGNLFGVFHLRIEKLEFGAIRCVRGEFRVFIAKNPLFGRFIANIGKFFDNFGI